MHYNGHGTDVNFGEDETEAGKWACKNGEFITIEEILNTIDDNLKNKILFVKIIADNCHGSGAYHRMVE